jgi:hypothetical protein
VPYQQADAFGGAPQERSKAISTYLSCTGPSRCSLTGDTVIPTLRCARTSIGSAMLRCVSPGLRGTWLVLSTKPMIFHGVTRSAEHAS